MMIRKELSQSSTNQPFELFSFNKASQNAYSIPTIPGILLQGDEDEEEEEEEEDFDEENDSFDEDEDDFDEEEDLDEDEDDLDEEEDEEEV